MVTMQDVTLTRHHVTLVDSMLTELIEAKGAVPGDLDTSNLPVAVRQLVQQRGNLLANVSLLMEDERSLARCSTSHYDARRALPRELDHLSLADAVRTLVEQCDTLVRQRDEWERQFRNKDAFLGRALKELPEGDLRLLPLDEGIAAALKELRKQRDKAEQEIEDLRSRPVVDVEFFPCNCTGKPTDGMTADEALTLVLERLRGTAVDGAILNEITAFIDGLHARLGSTE